MGERTMDWARYVYRLQDHHARYVRRIDAMPRKLMCQDCGGAGGHQTGKPRRRSRVNLRCRKMAIYPREHPTRCQHHQGHAAYAEVT